MPRCRSRYLLLALLVPATLGAQDPPPLRALEFMTGCWQGALGGGSALEEQFTTATPNLMLGLSRYTRDGMARSFEFHTISAIPTGSRLVPHPNGRASVPFMEASRGPDHVTWENPQHDFPQRIAYRRIAGDSLVARIELLDGSRAQEFRMGRVGCGG